MYHIRQFKPTLYLLLLLGISGFAVAAEEPGLWVLVVGGMALQAALVRGGIFRPMPRFLANLITLTAFAFFTMEWRAQLNTPIIIIGQFLSFMILIKLFELRGNRDYGQLLAISLLLMVAAAISTASLLFGLMLFVYLFLALYCCLLFHLKVETDTARVALRLPEEQVDPAQLRQDQRNLAGSMRRLTGLVSSVSMVMAVVVFLFFPRGGEGFLSRRVIPAERVLSGFSDRAAFEEIARIDQNPAEVATVRVSQNGQTVSGSDPLWLRGMTFDTYTGDRSSIPNPDEVSPWEWIRTEDDQPKDFDLSDSSYLVPENTDSGNAFVQEITLQPIGTRALFAMGGVVSIYSSNELRGQYHSRDGVLTTAEPMNQVGDIHYVVVSNGQLPPDEFGTYHSRSQIDPRITAFARRPEVSGTDASGRPLVDLLGTPQAPPDINFRIATAIEAYLRRNFSYTLDLTDAKDLMAGKDPIVAFLYDVKRGHCEYFAGAMTLMCQSLGIDARRVNGFRTTEFNPIGHFYIVRQSNAHAWVEVLTDRGWVTFDPTASDEAKTTPPSGLLAKMHNLFEYLEFQWGSNVIAYNQTNRDNLLQAMDYAMSRAAVSSGQSIFSLQPLLQRVQTFVTSPTLIGGLMVLLGLTIVTLIVWFFWGKVRLRRRAKRIGLSHLPPSRREQLARQLGFYDDLLRLLERHKIIPPVNQTPQEFGDSLSFLPNEVYDAIRRLTRLFYRIRFGEMELTSLRRRRLGNVISHLESVMDTPPG